MHSELKSWVELLKNHKLAVTLFSLLIVLQTSLLLLLFWQYQVLDLQIAQFTSNLEIIAELDEDLTEEQSQYIKGELEELEMVKAVEYWPPEKSALYVDNQVLSGYLAFLKKNELNLPFNALLRIALKDLGKKEDLEKIILEKYQGRLLVVDSSSIKGEQSFAGSFVDSINSSAARLKLFVAVLLIILLLTHAYFKSLLLSERCRGFHLSQILHLSPPYAFWPTLLVLVTMSLCLSAIGFLLVYLVISQILWLLTVMLFLAFLLLDLILVWTGRFVVKM